MVCFPAALATTGSKSMNQLLNSDCANASSVLVHPPVQLDFVVEHARNASDRPLDANLR